ncbi:uncharacterized protein LOC118242028 [Electrophorus electricus]|uniref:uncharacterized protein LOC118242028 n=1 Tax=Electrophorus electricus TaxID=8005 RepID=UPI0015CFD2EC|nr:uncharacterized protein LOC118242028 [Electrophorus electricus]
METSRFVLITLMCVVFSSQKRISGADVEMRVRRGDNATLYGDCIWEKGFNPVWFRNCSHENQPPRIITWNGWSKEVTSRYSSVWNPSKQIHDLLIKNITESVLGLYYCALHKIYITKDKTGVINSKDVYLYGKRTILLSLHDPGAELTSTSTPPVSDCGVYRKLLFTVCPVCVLLSSLISSTCVYCFCRKRNSEAEVEQRFKNKSQIQKYSNTDEQAGGGEVCYASLDNLNVGKKRPKKTRIQNSDFSTYSEVRTG